MGKQDVVREMRTLLADAANPPDFPLLGAKLAVTLSSAPLDRLVDLQAATDMESFWGSLVRCIAASEDPEEPAEALTILQRATRSATPAPTWEAAEAACIPGRPAPSPPGPAPPTPLTPAPARDPPTGAQTAPSPNPAPTPEPPSVMQQWVTLSGIRGLRSAAIMSALKVQTGWDITLPLFSSPFEKDTWRVRVPAEEWLTASQGASDISISVGGRAVVLSPLTRWSLLPAGGGL